MRLEGHGVGTAQAKEQASNCASLTWGEPHVYGAQAFWILRLATYKNETTTKVARSRKTGLVPKWLPQKAEYFV